MAIGYFSWDIRTTLFSKNYRLEPLGWQKIGRELPTDGEIIALTHDYGRELQYYAWTSPRIWPYVADLSLSMQRNQNLNAKVDQVKLYNDMFASLTQGCRYFLVDLFGELDAQPLLKSRLYDHYPIYKQGDGYVIFDLSKPH